MNDLEKIKNELDSLRVDRQILIDNMKIIKNKYEDEISSNGSLKSQIQYLQKDKEQIEFEITKEKVKIK